MRVVLASILFLSLPLRAQLVSETAVSDVTYVHGEELAAAAGSDGRNFLVLGTRGVDPAVYAHRVSESGELLDRTSIRVALPRGAYNTRPLGAFWAKGAYTIVIWMQLSPGADGQAVFVARIDAEGRLIAPARQILSGRTVDTAASNGTRIVLAAQPLAVLDGEGNVLEAAVDLPLQAGSSNADFQIASNSAGFVLAWASASGSQNGVGILALDPQGHPAGAVQTVAGAGAHRIASNGSDYVLIVRDGAGNDFAQHVSVSAQLLQQSLLPKFQAPSLFPSIMWNGIAYVVAASTGPFSVPTAARLDRNGAPTDMTTIFQASDTTGRGAWTNLASNGTHLLASWSESATTSRRWFGGLVDRNLQLSAKFPIGITASPQHTPSVATNGSQLFAAWEEGGKVYGARISLAGERLDAHPIEIGFAPAGSPRVVWDGQAYVVAWQSTQTSTLLGYGTTSVLATRVTPGGTFAGSTTLIGPCADGFDIASNGETVFAVASQCQAPRRLLATRLHGSGPPEPAVVVSPGDMSTAWPSVAWSGTQVLVAWSEVFSNLQSADLPLEFRATIRAARVSASMTVLDPEPLRIAVSDDASNFKPHVASDGGTFMVAWTTATASETAPRARSVAADATLGDVTAGLGLGIASSLIWDGRHFALAFSTLAGDTFLRRLGNDSPVAIEGGPDDSSAASLATLGDGAVIAAYERVATEPVYGSVPRVFVRSVVPTRLRPVRGR